MRELRRFSVFSIVSGTGWLLDVGLLLALVAAGMGAFLANASSAFAAVTFVWLLSRTWVFGHAGDGTRAQGYGLYLAYHAIAIPVASGLIALVAAALEGAAAASSGALARVGIAHPPSATVLAAGAAKVLVTPLSLVANFFFARWLLERRVRSTER